MLCLVAFEKAHQGASRIAWQPLTVQYVVHTQKSVIQYATRIAVAWTWITIGSKLPLHV